jgi:hypothetical protein
MKRCQHKCAILYILTIVFPKKSRKGIGNFMCFDCFPPDYPRRIIGCRFFFGLSPSSDQTVNSDSLHNYRSAMSAKNPPSGWTVD